MTIQEIENLAVNATFIAAGLAMIAFLAELGLRKQAFKFAGMAGMGVALVASLTTLVVRGIIAQHAPWSNLWESMITVLFGTLVFYFIVEIWYKPRFFGVVAAPLVMLIIGGASILPPGFKGAAPLMPALQSYWIKVHVLIMLFSYAAFTMSFAAALAYFFFAWRGRKQAAAAATEGPPPDAFTAGENAPDAAVSETTGGSAARRGGGGGAILTPAFAMADMRADGTAASDADAQLAFFDELTYRLILVGFPLLMLGIITGAMWANGAWGTYWSWDPKETWALITWFIYAAYLHARLSRDWTGHKAASLAALGYASVLVTYIGVNYISQGLHSYGFIFTK